MVTKQATKRKKRSIFKAPKPRDLEIYERWSTESTSQRALAKEFGLTQAAVSKICIKLRRWEGEPELTTNRETQHRVEQGRLQRLHMLTRQHKRRLEWGYAQMCEKWRGSQTPLATIKDRLYKGELTHETMTRTRDPNPRFLNDAIRFSERMLQFEGIKLDGTVDFNTKHRLPEEPELTYDEQMAEQRRRIEAVLPEVEAWERRKAEGEMKAGNQAGESSSFLAPSPRYSGERVGVRGLSSERALDGNSSLTSLRGNPPGIQRRSAPANEPPGQARGREERSSSARADSKSSPALPHSSSSPPAEPKPASKVSVDSRGRLLFEADGYHRPIPTNWIEPPPSKFPVQWVEEGY